MEKPTKNIKKGPPKDPKKAPANKPKKTVDGGKNPPKPKAAPRRKVSASKTIKSKDDPVNPPTRAETQHMYFEVLGSRIADRAFELYMQRGEEHGHDLEDWLEAERQILPKEISDKSKG